MSDDSKVRGSSPSFVLRSIVSPALGLSIAVLTQAGCSSEGPTDSTSSAKASAKTSATASAASSATASAPASAATAPTSEPTASESASGSASTAVASAPPSGSPSGSGSASALPPVVGRMPTPPGKIRPPGLVPMPHRVGTQAPGLVGQSSASAFAAASRPVRPVRRGVDEGLAPLLGSRRALVRSCA